MEKSLENLSDAELERGAARTLRYYNLIKRNAKTFPPAVAILVFAACVNAGPLSAAIGLPAVLAVGCVAAFATVVVCCMALPGLLGKLDSKCGHHLWRIDTEMKMRKLERLPSFQEGLRKIAQRLSNTFGAAAAKTFHEGTDEDLTVKKPLQLKKPGEAPKKKSFLGL